MIEYKYHVCQLDQPEEGYMLFVVYEAVKSLGCEQNKVIANFFDESLANEYISFKYSLNINRIIKEMEA